MDVPLYHSVVLESGGVVTGSSRGTILTSGGAHVKGSWTQLVASMPDGITGFWLCIHGHDSYRYLLDLGIGTGPTVVISNYYWSSRPGNSPNAVFIPLALPAGQALSGRIQCGGASKIVFVSVIFERGSFAGARGLNRCTTYGAVTASSDGTTVDPGGTANTKGSWAEITSATSADLQAILLAFGNGADTYPPSYPTANWLLDLGIGASPTVLIPNLALSAESASDSLETMVFGPIPIFIPAGSRIAARAQSNVIDAVYRTVRLVVIGVG